MEFCALWHDHGYCSFTTRVGGKSLNQILLEVLMNCTKHFDLSISLTASYVTIFMISGVCRLYFSGLVCSVPSLDECLIEINYERWQSFLLGGLVAVNFMVNIVVCCKLQQLQECCKVDFVS